MTAIHMVNVELVFLLNYFYQDHGKEFMDINTKKCVSFIRS